MQNSNQGAPIAPFTTLDKNKYTTGFRARGKFLVVILGPTAAGKTSLAIEIAKTFNTEIISADSRQFFREMNIGTGKPSAKQLKEVKHHFINSLSVTDDYNVGMFERDAHNVLEKIFNPNTKGGNTDEEKNISGSLQGGGQTFAVMVGGSGLYINAVCHGFDEMPEVNKEVRANLMALYKENGIDALQSLLKKYDEKYYGRVDVKNPHRLIRAIEVCMVTGKSYAELRKGEKQKRNFTFIKIGLEMEREKLYEKINARVDEMMKQGLLDEVKSLVKYKHLNSLQTIGYLELFDFIEGKTDLSSAVALIKQNTRNFAKRQMTWFKKDKETAWFEPNKKEEIDKYILGKTANQ